MMTEKYGFVYIWYDRKHKRYYIGCRWGRETDGYVCSSSWMKQAYKKRSEDFKRRILKTNITCRKELLTEEHRWLSMIKDSELGTKYYNLSKHHFGHWSATPNAKSVGQKISEAHANHPDWGNWSRGKKVTEETKEKLRQANKKQFENKEQRLSRRQKTLAQWNDPEFRRKQSEKRSRPRGPMPQATRDKISAAKRSLNISCNQPMG